MIIKFAEKKARGKRKRTFFVAYRWFQEFGKTLWSQRFISCLCSVVRLQGGSEDRVLPPVVVDVTTALENNISRASNNFGRSSMEKVKETIVAGKEAVLISFDDFGVPA